MRPINHKIMKKLTLLTSALLLFSIHTRAQDAVRSQPEVGKASFGIYGGINFQNINGKDAGGDKLTNSLVTKFHIGVNEELPIAPEFYFQVGIQFMGKGTKGNVQYIDDAGSHTITRKVNLNYLEMPLNLVYKPLVGSGHLILGFGPYFGYAATGRTEFTGDFAPEDTDIQFIKTAPQSDRNNLVYFKRLDVGANFMVGYQFQNGINLVLNSQLGLVPINSKTESKLVNKNTGFGLSLGWRI